MDELIGRGIDALAEHYGEIARDIGFSCSYLRLGKLAIYVIPAALVLMIIFMWGRERKPRFIKGAEESWRKLIRATWVFGGLASVTMTFAALSKVEKAALWAADHNIEARLMSKKSPDLWCADLLHSFVEKGEYLPGNLYTVQFVTYVLITLATIWVVVLGLAMALSFAFAKDEDNGPKTPKKSAPEPKSQEKPVAKKEAHNPEISYCLNRDCKQANPFHHDYCSRCGTSLTPELDDDKKAASQPRRRGRGRTRDERRKRFLGE